ncbi:MAG TPA: lytic murein transglycosylase [Dermatophilaceae bacterium]|nr:lytic murein transglycosylase [Dermatophilaceae bacterium]
MKKIILFLAPMLVVLFGIPLAVALVVMTVSAPAASEELRTIACGGPIAGTERWQPPLQQAAFTVFQRGFGRESHSSSRQRRMPTGQDLVKPKPSGGGLVVAIGAGKHRGFDIWVDNAPIDSIAWLHAHGVSSTGQVVALSTPNPNPLTLPAGGNPIEEGGVGFPLPPPGQPRQASLHNPPLPIPAAIKGYYVAAADRYAIPWALLAGIGMEETGHGRTTATSVAGAQGLMQFMPATWASMGVDGDGDGRADITNAADSAMSAANYLTKSGVTKGPEGVRRAIFAYNHADWYVNDVLYYAAAYGGGIVLGGVTYCPPGQGNPNLPPLTNQRLRTVLEWAISHVGDRYIMGANGPDAWDCSSFTQAAYHQIGISTPRTAQAQRDWLAAGNGFRVDPTQARPADLIFYDSYLGPNTIGHVAMVLDPGQQSTVEAMSTSRGVTYGSYAGKAVTAHIFEIWRVGNVADAPTRTTA